MIIQQITDPKLAHFAYLLGCQRTGKAILIDPQRDINRYLKHAAAASLTIVAVADTHIHADYLSGLRQFAELPGVMIYASGEGGDDWQYDWLAGSSCPYRLLKNGDSITVGSIRLDVRHTPGHTPEHLTYLVTDLVRNPDQPLGLISGDFVFAGDVGRPDLLERAAHQAGTMESSAKALYESLKLFKHLSPDLLLWPGHGAGSACGKSLGAVPISTVGYELAANPSIKASRDQDEFLDYIVSGQPEPPAYFARMKTENREGPAILKTLPEPKAVKAGEIDALIKTKAMALVDTRPWEQYQAGHLPGALFVPFDRSFTTTIGSYVLPGEKICLIIDPGSVMDAVIDCIRIGLDQISSYLSPETLNEYVAGGGRVQRTNGIAMAELLGQLERPDIFLLDVRREVELAETGEIKGAYNIAHLQLLLRHEELPRGKNIHLYCRGADRSRQAYGFLESLGYTVTHVEGGITAWQESRRLLVPHAMSRQQA